MNDQAVVGIRGWLLVYVIWMAISIVAIPIWVYIHEVPGAEALAQLQAALPEYMVSSIYKIAWGYVIVTSLWYLLYAWVLWNLLQRRQGIVKYIRWMIAGTPIFNALMPFATGIAVFCLIPGVALWGAIKGAYVTEIIMFLVYDFLVAFGWFVYFLVSARVKNTWPNG